MKNVRIKLFSRHYETVEDSPCTGKSSCLHTFQSETICIDSAFRACASRSRNSTLEFFNFDNDMQQVRQMTPFYNSGLCMSALSRDQVFVVLKLLGYKSNQARFYPFSLRKTRTGFQKPFSTSIIRLTKPVASRASRLVYQPPFAAKPVGCRLEGLNYSTVRINVFVLV